MAVLVVLDVLEVGQVLGVDALHHPFGDHGDAVALALTEPFDDGTEERVDDRLEADVAAVEFLRDERQCRARRLAHPQRQVAGLAAHGDDEVPARRRVGVDHEVLDDLRPVVPRRLKPKVSMVGGRSRSLSIVLGTCTTRMRPADFSCSFMAENAVSSPPMVTSCETFMCSSARHRVLQVLRVERRVGARDADDRAAAEVDAADGVDGERQHVLGVALHDPLETVPDADDLDPLQDAADGGRADDAVDPRCRTTADEDGELLPLAHDVPFVVPNAPSPMLLEGRREVKRVPVGASGNGRTGGLRCRPGEAAGKTAAAMTMGIDHRLRLPDGRRLGYAEFGDSVGAPVLYCHGGFCSRLDVAFAAETCRSSGVRLLAVDRPGIGLSDPQPGRRLLDWPDDVTRLADALGLDRFAVLGWSAGGPYALACAHRLRERISRVGLVASMAPLESPEMLRGLGLPADRVLFQLAARAPWLAAALLSPLRFVPARLVRTALLRDLRSPSDRKILTALSVGEATGFLFEGLRQGAAGVTEDYRVTGGPWGFDLEEIAGEVVIWHGAEDDLVPLRHAQRLAERLPEARLLVVPGRGHFLLRSELRAVIAELVSADRSA